MIRLIVSPTVGDAWEMCVRHVLRKGVSVTTEDGEETLETDELIVKVDNPFSEPMISTLAPYGSQMFDAYVDQLLNGTNSKFDYDYHGRLFNHPIVSYEWTYDHLKDDDGWVDRDCGVDQIADIVETLQRDKQSRRSVAVAWNVGTDGDYARQGTCSVPCLQWLQFLVRDGKLQLKVLFRSNDILLAMHANMYALVHLQKYVADQLGLPVGSYTHIVTVPHIYVKRDASELKKWV